MWNLARNELILLYFLNTSNDSRDNKMGGIEGIQRKGKD